MFSFKDTKRETNNGHQTTSIIKRQREGKGQKNICPSSNSTNKDTVCFQTPPSPSPKNNTRLCSSPFSHSSHFFFFFDLDHTRLHPLCHASPSTKERHDTNQSTHDPQNKNRKKKKKKSREKAENKEKKKKSNTKHTKQKTFLPRSSSSSSFVPLSLFAFPPRNHSRPLTPSRHTLRLHSGTVVTTQSQGTQDKDKKKHKKHQETPL